MKTRIVIVLPLLWLTACGQDLQQTENSVSAAVTSAYAQAQAAASRQANDAKTTAATKTASTSTEEEGQLEGDGTSGRETEVTTTSSTPDDSTNTSRTLTSTPRWINSLSSDFTTGDFRTNSDWNVSTWGNLNHKYSAANVGTQDHELQLKVNGGTIPGFTTTGAEINSAAKNYLYGSYRVVMKTSSVAGTIAGFFYYLSDSSEIDIEVLSSENKLGKVNFTVHKMVSDKSSVKADLGFDPSADYHEYRFDWFPDKVDFYVDGRLLTSLASPVVVVPSKAGSIMLNHWSFGSPLWGFGPPLQDAYLHVKRIDFLY